MPDASASGGTDPGLQAVWSHLTLRKGVTARIH